MNTNNKGGLIKIYFNLNKNEQHSHSTESLWAKALTVDKGGFVLENSPFYFKGVSYQDIVKATPQPNGSDYNFCGVIKSGGHSTYRILFDPNAINFPKKYFDQYLSKLELLGCTYEGASEEEKKLYAIDVPSHADIYAVYGLLDEGEKKGIWCFEEAHVGHKLNEK